jgi:hypothetical protein
VDAELEKIPNPETGQGEESDPTVLAYRMGGFGTESGVVRVRRSELARDQSLIPFTKSAISHDFDAERSLEQKHPIARPADSHVEEKLQRKLMYKEIRKRIDTEDVEFNSLADLNLEIKSVNDKAAQYILMIVTDQLKAQGLWRDEDQDLTMSEAFPIDQAKVDIRVRGDDLKALREGTFIEESEMTMEEASTDFPSKDVGARAGTMRLPVLATPMIHNLMRSSPRDLYHQIARRMIDGHFFEDRPDFDHLYRACFFASKGVEDEMHFDVLMRATRQFPHYTFKSFQVERIELRRVLRDLIARFFDNTPAIKRCLKHQTDPEKKDPRNVWSRFFKVWNGLTPKQQAALEKVHMAQEPLTRAQAAKYFGISIDSLDSRLKTAMQKFKNEFWELEGITPRRLPRAALTAAFTLNGLWRYKSAAFIHKIYRVDLASGVRSEIEWRKIPRSKNLDWKTIARIKAEIIENCPIPHLHYTDYFDGIRPTIASLGRRPGTMRELRPNIDFDADSSD